MSTNPVTLAELDWTFGDRLRKIRRVVGASQADFASALSQGRHSLAAWESCLNEPRNPVAIAKRIELAYGIPATWTLGLETQRPGPSGPGQSYTTRDSNPEPADLGSEDELAARRTARSAVEVEQVAA